MSNVMWKDDQIQFMRLLAEIQASKLTTEQYIDLAKSMDLSFDEIDQLLQRATDAFEHYINMEVYSKGLSKGEQESNARIQEGRETYPDLKK